MTIVSDSATVCAAAVSEKGNATSSINKRQYDKFIFKKYQYAV